MKKIALLLALALTVPFAVAACKTKSPETTTSGSGTVTTSSDSNIKYDKDGYELDDLPELDFGNKEIKILHWKEALCPEFSAEYGQSNLETSVYTRNLTVESRLKVKLIYEATPGNNNNLNEYLGKVHVDVNVNASAEFDIYAAYSMGGASMAMSGYVEDLMEYEYLNFEKPWWPKNLIGQSTINDKLYFASGDISVNLIYYMFIMFFNKDIVESRGAANPQDLVDSDNWTLETMLGITKGVYEDADDDGKRSDGDKYGLVVAAAWSDSFFHGSGLRTVTKDVAGAMVVSESWGSAKTQSLLTTLCDFFSLESGYIPATPANTTAIFNSHRSMFLIHSAGYVKDTLSSKDVKFGIVPLPKYDDNQDEFFTTLGFTYTMYTISVKSSNKTEVSAVLECLASTAYRTTTPELFEKTFKTQYSTVENLPMWNLIRDSVDFDLGRVFTTNIDKLTYSLFRNALTKNTAETWTSDFSKKKGAIDKYLTDIMLNFA